MGLTSTQAEALENLSRAANDVAIAFESSSPWGWAGGEIFERVNRCMAAEGLMKAEGLERLLLPLDEDLARASRSLRSPHPGPFATE